MYKIKTKPQDFIVKEITTIKSSEKGSYAYFILKKELVTTLDAVQRIADFLRINAKNIGFAGNKDKIAVTEQYISVPADYARNLSNFKSKNISLMPAGCGDIRICLGDLEGNMFQIIVNNAEKPKIPSRFINYFGEQRFSENNIKIGKYILKGKLEKAALLCRERRVLEHLKAHKNDHVGALKKLPKKLLTLYINAYQSYLWNNAVDELLKTKKDDSQTDIQLEIIGFGTEFKDPQVEKIYNEIMKEEGISLRDFIIRWIPDLSSEGYSRNIFVEPKNLKIGKIENKTYKLTFFLPKGCYATEVLRQMFS